jgi:D-alanyl-D-alanine carboxypeptidase
MNRLTAAAIVGLLALSATSFVAVGPVAAADPTPTPTLDPTPTPTPAATPTPTPAATPTPTPAATPTPTPAATPTPTPSATPTPAPAAPSPIPSPSPSPSPSNPTATNPPACRTADVTTRYPAYTAFQKTLLDWIYRLPSTYAPRDLTSVSKAGLTGSGSVRKLLIPDLTAMAKAARAAGARLAVQSAYRSYSTQVGVFNSWARQIGYAQAIIGSARPGHSEHQLGTVIDFKSYGGGAPWSLGGYDWATSKAGRWMMNNAWKYGFVLSYPKNMASRVCYGYEPWHYRYYGRAIAAAIHSSGLTPRYWLWGHGSNQ